MNFSWLDGPNVKTTYYGLLPIKHLLPQIWVLDLQSKEKSDFESEEEFETKVKSWYPDQCTWGRNFI